MKINFVRTIMLAPLAFSLLACAEPRVQSSWDFPGEQHKITVKETNERLNLVVGQQDAGLSLAQKSAILRFVAVWRDKGQGPVALTIPAGSANAQTAVVVAAETRKILYEQGLSWQQMVGGNYQAIGQNKPPVILSFRRYVATAQGCSVAKENLAYSLSNKVSANFGCAVAVNTAAMIADPYDLVAPREQDAASTDRRLVTYGKYVAGEATGVERSSDETASVSDAVE